MTDDEYTKLLEHHCSQPRLAEWSVVALVLMVLVMGVVGLVRFHCEGDFKPAVLQ